MAKKEKSYTTTISDMVEGQPMTREAYRNLTLDVADEWVKVNHPEIKDKWISICNDEFEIKKIFPEKKRTVVKYDDNGNPIMRKMNKRDGTVEEVEATTEVPYEKGFKRELTIFEIYEWLCKEYSMYPVKKETVKDKRRNVGQWD